MSKICFIVGHGKSSNGGYDSGATSNGFHEFKIAREIAKYAQEYYNTNYTEQCDLMNFDGDLYLMDRVKKVNANNYDLIAEFHLNAGGGTGPEVYYYHGDSTGNKYAAAISAAIAKQFGMRNRGAKVKMSGSKDYFAIIRDTRPRALLIETVFIDTADLEKVKTAAGQKECGETIAVALATARGVGRKEAVKPVAPPAPGKTVMDIAKEVIAGKWGNGVTRKEKLQAAGYDYATVQSEVNRLLSGGKAPAKSVTEIAKEVIAGKWGNGATRRKQLESDGYNYAEVQNKVNEILYN